MKKTIIDLFENSVATYGAKTFLWEKKTDRFEPITFAETKQQVYRLAAGLMSLGVKASDKVALLSEGRNAWIIGELGILYAGAVNVPLSIKLEEKNDLIFRIRHSESKYIMVSGSQLKKIRAIIADCPLVEKVIVFDPQTTFEEKEIPLESVLEAGNTFLATRKAELLKRSRSVQNNDMANISYTSGTTADPKGIMLSHRNYTANVEQAMSLMEITPDDSNLIIIPLDHCFGHVAGFYSFMAYGANVGTIQVGRTPIESLKNIPLNINEFKPTILMSVPALAKNFRKNIETGIRQQGPKIEKLFQHALKTAYSYNKEGFNKGGIGQLHNKLLLKLYDKLLFSKVRQGLGGKMKFFIGGGALLDIELQRFFYAIGIPMFQGYGLSEATPVISSNGMKKHKLGSSGALVADMDLKICDLDGKELPQGEKGEIVIRGENVMLGYWKNPEATAETIVDGWLHTGDMGYMDADGFLYVLGRFKSLLISSDGEKYSPEGIEEGIVDKSKYIEQMMLHNNQDPYTVALVVPDKERLKQYVKSIRPDVDWNSQEAKALALKKISEEVNQYRSGGLYAGEFPERWLPAAIAVLPEGFTEQNLLLNSTMKIVRGKIEERYAERLQYLFTPEGKNIVNELNLGAFCPFS
ncbi:MAG: Long-chain-fatty-acid--CoA ligase FadD15 [Candidatus Ordinivivax streblomastigis]|uniref:Long-chain-fatty-acid--CoA ligase FadD15 n=1 Tax=Candidatus Ordinivivax streblomastigis TaxID=2540710 RepID=A0A5M8P248_9BACT|nr:MAG: Long-chain-fatty-acid--CoA ligase FadD15 [Candidatus Ordinivivax streblomastigis]